MGPFPCSVGAIRHSCITLMPRTIAIGDIHSCAVALAKLIEAAAPHPDDTVVPLGDYVDRGIESSTRGTDPE